jgi:hypothetical protein
MRSVPPLALDATDLFDEIAAVKQQPRRGQMQNARAKIFAAYRVYEDVAPDVGGLNKASLTSLEMEAMRNAYTVATKPMTALRSELLQRTCVVRCPFCGISESSTLDHYLPKEHYPEFSVFPKNLVPSCPVCNTRKRDHILGEGTNVRVFLHPYYDVVPHSVFLDVRARMEAGALILSYRLTRPKGMALQTFHHLRSHFNALDLADRYRRMGLEHLGGQYPALRRAYGPFADAERVVEKLTEGAEDFEEISGPNYWLAKLYRALAGNNEFCDGGFEAVRI